MMTIQNFKEEFTKKYPRTSSFTSGIALMFVDCIAIMISIGLAFFLVNFVDHSLINFKSFVNYAVYLPLIIIVFYTANLYPGIMLNPADEVRHLALGAGFSFIGIAVSISVETDERIPIIIALIIAVPIAVFLLPSFREVGRHIFSKRNWWGVPAVIYETQDSGNFVIDRLLRRSEFGYKPAIIINNSKDSPSEYNGIPVFSNTKEIEEAIKELGIKVAMLCDYTGETTDIMTNYRYTINIPKVQTNTNNLNARDLGGILGFSSTHFLTRPECIFAKRCVDLFLLLLSAPLVLPITLIVAILVKLTSRGPIFYGHKRVGKDGKTIKCWKFRSMVTNADQMLDKIFKEHPEMREEWEKDRKFTNDPRVTKLGKILRRTSLDELPQLWNIFCGEMSFVGPRPVTESELSRYGKLSNFILSVKPGLSGMWQISGRSDTSYEQRITLDSYYIQNWSTWLDIWIIIKTIWVVIKGKGAY